MSEPTDAPPSYESATGKKPAAKDDIPEEHRRSMEDEHRELPEGWVRQYDTTHHHQFFVDTRQDPPRSIWHHPYDDDEYLETLSPKERERISNLNESISAGHAPSEKSDDQNDAGPSTAASGAAAAASSSAEQPHGLHKFGRKLKDRITMTTHEEREAERAQRAERERQAYEAHRQARQAMAKAAQTGQPQFLFKDRDGKDVYIEPPQGPGAPAGSYGYNPYTQGPYSQPNARFVRPQYDYYRPGYSSGLELPLLGGLLGGALLGAALF